MNVEIGTEAAQFSEKEYISGIFVAVCAVDLYVKVAQLSNWQLWAKKMAFQRTLHPIPVPVVIFALPTCF